MAKAEDVRALEADCPWQEPDFRAGLAALSSSTALASRQYAADARVLARLAGQVPRCAWDETGATPWTSFRQEIAVARRTSSPAAASEIRAAVRLVGVLPHTLHLLEDGRLTVLRARTFVDELDILDDELAGQIDADHADTISRLAPWRIKHTVRRAALTLDPDVSVQRRAAATARRSVSFTPHADGQADVFLTGPAVPLTRWYTTLDNRARTLRSAGDPRTLDALRFDLATSTFPCTSHPPTDRTTTASPATPPPPTTAAAAAATTTEATATAPCTPAADTDTPTGTDQTNNHVADDDVAAAGLRLSGVEAADTDCRRSRPVQANIVIPVETALGLSNEPAWLDGYGWLDAPTSRELLLDAELRQVCTQTGTGQLVDVHPTHRRPAPTPEGVRQSLLDMLTADLVLSDLPWRTEPQHDPSDALRTFTTLRDRGCDGPTQPSTPAPRCQLDHDQPHPHGPTAAWNLITRATRTHQLKHYGWTPVRTPTGTLWTSPAGQLVDVPHQHQPPPGVDPDPHGRALTLPDPRALHDTDRYQLTPPTDDDLPPWLPPTEHPPPTTWTCLGHDNDAPF